VKYSYGNGTEFVARGCSSAVTGNGCTDFNYNGVNVISCTCSTDICNGSEKLNPMHNTIVFLALIIVVLSFNFCF